MAVRWIGRRGVLPKPLWRAASAREAAQARTPRLSFPRGRTQRGKATVHGLSPNCEIGIVVDRSAAGRPLFRRQPFEVAVWLRHTTHHYPRRRKILQIPMRLRRCAKDSPHAGDRSTEVIAAHGRCVAVRMSAMALTAGRENDRFVSGHLSPRDESAFRLTQCA